MTVSTNTQKDTGTAGTGGQQVISFTFPVQVDTEVAAVKQHTTTGAITAMVKDTDYSVTLTDTGSNNYTGSITTLSPYVSTSHNVYVYRDTTDTQAYNPINNDDMDAETLEAAIDKLFMLIADLQEQVGRCIKIPMPETNSVELDNYVDRASTTFGFDSNGDISLT